MWAFLQMGFGALADFKGNQHEAVAIDRGPTIPMRVSENGGLPVLAGSARETKLTPLPF